MSVTNIQLWVWECDMCGFQLEVRGGHMAELPPGWGRHTLMYVAMGEKCSDSVHFCGDLCFDTYERAERATSGGRP